MKILSNKKYNELILKSCRGMFGAVTDDMLLRNNALLNEENKILKQNAENNDKVVDKVNWENMLLKKENQKYKEVIDKAIELLGNYKHYSIPDEKQNSDNEDLVNNAFDILKEVE